MERVEIVRKLKDFFSKKNFIYVLFFLGMSTALSVSYPFIYKIFIDRVLFEGNIRILKLVLFLMAVWLVCNALVKRNLCKVRSEFLVMMLYSLKQRLIDNTMKRNLNYYLQKTANEIKRVVEDDCNEVENFFVKDIFEFALSILNASMFIVIMMVLSPSLLVGCMIFFVFSYFEAKLIKKGVNRNATELRKAMSQEDHACSDEIKNLKEIKCLNCEEMIQHLFSERSKRLIKLIKKEKVYAYVNKYLSAMNHDLITRFFIYILGGSLVIRGKMSISSFLVFLGFYESFVKEARKIMDSNFNLSSKVNKLENILDYLAPDDTRDCGDKYIIESIKFKNVYFTYPGNRNGRYVLENFNCEFHRGNTYLVQAKSGAGKSTLMKLLYKEFEHYEGSISINGKELSEYCGDKEYYSHITVAASDSKLFHTSIKENLLYASPEATDTQLYTACAMAEFDDDIAKMPQGLDTSVGERGNSLSGGQKERLVMSRLFLKKSDLYILDEALDEISMTDEVQILDRIREVNPDSIIVIISHRLLDCRNAELIGL